MFELLSIAVGAGIAKHVLASWLGEDMPTAIGGELIGAIAGKLGGRQAAKANRQIEEIRDAVIGGLEDFLAHEPIDQANVQLVADALGATLEAAPTTTLLVGGRFEASKVARAFADSCPEVRAGLAAIDQGLYDRALVSTAAALRRIAEKLPNFQTEVAAAQLSALDDLVSNVDAILSELRSMKADVQTIRDRPEEEAKSFEDAYRRSLIKKVAELRLFGLPYHDKAGGEVDLDVAYIPLRLQHKESKWLAGLDYPSILTLLPFFGNRLLIEGAAGSGKTTLLQWTTLNALKPPDNAAQLFAGADFVTSLFLNSAYSTDDSGAQKQIEEFIKIGRNRSKFDSLRESVEVVLHHHRRLININKFGEKNKRYEVLLNEMERLFSATAAKSEIWWTRLPIFLRLRDCPSGHLPKPNDLPGVVARAAGNPPEAWLRKRLQAGEALLLIDGIDEVPEANREQLRRDLDDYSETYPDTFMIVTSRPAAVLRGRWAQSFRHRLSVQPMSTDDIAAFIAQWHKALARRSRKPIDVDVASLTHQVLSKPALRQLAETPLLCAAICYLHRIKRGEIPRRAARLNEEIIKQLVHQLDIDRLQNEGYERLVPALSGLDLDEKTAIIARLALAMVRTEESSLSRDKALPAVRDGLAALRKDNDPEAVLGALQERSGVLRGASEELVEFSHNALKTHLAASRLVLENAGAKEVIRLAEATVDPDLILLTATKASIPYRQDILGALLDGVPANEPKARVQQILALRASVDEIADSTLRDRLADLMPELFPPRDMNEAAALAELGDRALPFLPHRPEAEAEWNAASVRCLKRIASDPARKLLENFLGTQSMEVATELAEVFHPLRIAGIAKTILSTDWSSFDPIPPGVRASIFDIEPLLSRKRISALNLTSTGLSDSSLSKIHKITGLQTLWLSGTHIGDAGLTHLATLAEVKDLRLSGTQITNEGLAHLAKLTSLRSIWLSGTQIGDDGIAHLVGLTNLEELSLGSTAVSDEGMVFVSKLLKLKSLWLDRTKVSNDGLAQLSCSTGLQYLSLDNIDIDDHGISHLAGLTELEGLSLDNTQIGDDGFAHLANLTHLQFLSLDNTQISDEGLANLADLFDLQNLVLSNTRISDDGLAHLANLSSLQVLWIEKTQISDEGLAHLANLTKLQALFLARNRISNDGLAHLANLTDLQQLQLIGNQVDPSHPLLAGLRDRGLQITI